MHPHSLHHVALTVPVDRCFLGGDSWSHVGLIPDQDQGAPSQTSPVLRCHSFVPSEGFALPRTFERAVSSLRSGGSHAHEGPTVSLEHVSSHTVYLVFRSRRLPCRLFLDWRIPPRKLPGGRLPHRSLNRWSVFGLFRILAKIWLEPVMAVSPG